MRADRPSLTASMVAAIRALYTELPTPYRLASDPVADALLHPIFQAPARALALAQPRLTAGLVHNAIGLATFGLSFHVELRTRAIDEALEASLADGVDQVVLLGAGLDNRAYRIEALKNARVIEVDHPSTQNYKRERLAAAGDPLPAAREVVRAPINFEHDDLEEVLLKAGLDRSRRSFWIWEGVTIYLTPEAIRATLGHIANLSPAGSRLAMTYGIGLASRLEKQALALGRAAVGLLGEPFVTPLSKDEMGSLLEEFGLHRLSDETTQDWGRRYWDQTFAVRAIERLAIAERIAR
jgi:methyltransferase (TIGR00027 family)